MVIETLVIAGVAAAGAAVFRAVLRRRQKAGEVRPAEAEPEPSAPRVLVAGEIRRRDVISHLGTDEIVEAVLTVEEAGEPVVVVARLGEDLTGRHLVVEPSARPPRCSMGTSMLKEGILGGAASRWLQSEQGELQLVSRISARLVSDGFPGVKGRAPCELARYEGPGGLVGLVVVSGNMELEVIGSRVATAGLRLLPGDLVEEESRES